MKGQHGRPSHGGKGQATGSRARPAKEGRPDRSQVRARHRGACRGHGGHSYRVKPEEPGPGRRPDKRPNPEDGPRQDPKSAEEGKVSHRVREGEVRRTARMPEKGTQKESKGWRKTGSRVQSEVQPKGGSPGPTKAETGTAVAAANRATRERLSSSPRGRTRGGAGQPHGRSWSHRYCTEGRR